MDLYNLFFQDNIEVDNPLSRDKKVGLQGIPWKDFSKVGFTLGRDGSTTKGAGKNSSVKQSDKSDSARKSKRASKKRAVDGFDDYENDDELRYLEKLKNAKYYTGFGDDDEEASRKHRRLSKFSGVPPNTEIGASSRMGKDGKKRSPSEDTDYEEEEEPASDGEPDSKKNKKSRKEPADPLVEPRREMTLTTRQKALQSGRDASVPGGSAVEFPNGLPPAPSRSMNFELALGIISVVCFNFL